MSVTRLSERDQAPPEGQSHYSTPDVADRPGKTDESKLDAVIESAISKIPSAQDDEPTPTPKRKDLDSIISENLDKHEAAVEDREAWSRSKDARAALDHAYKGDGMDINKTLTLFADMADQLQMRPRETALAVAEAYMRASKHVTTPEAKARPQAEIIDGRRYSGKVLDHVLEQAIESAPAESQTYENTKQVRERFKKMWPELSFDQAVERVRYYDQRLRDDPIGVSAELFALAGGAVTPRQQAVEAERDTANTLVAQATQALPAMNDPIIRQRMAHIIDSNPAYNSVDEVTALQHAYQVAVSQHQQESQHRAAVVNYATVQLQVIRKSNPHLAESIIQTLESDKNFHKLVENVTDGVAIFQSAIGYAKSKMANNQHALSKAQRVRPVKSSTGAVAPSGAAKGGIDSAIAEAMKHFCASRFRKNHVSSFPWSRQSQSSVRTLAY
jgi:hypothetical protein